VAGFTDKLAMACDRLRARYRLTLTVIGRIIYGNVCSRCRGTLTDGQQDTRLRPGHRGNRYQNRCSMARRPSTLSWSAGGRL